MDLATNPPSDQKTIPLPLSALHRQLGAKMLAMSGYYVPLHYKNGIKSEHLWTRSQAGLFDVSHLGQILLEGVNVQSSLETLVPSDLRNHPLGRTRYSLLLTSAGGVIDDLMISKLAADRLYLVVNANRKQAVLSYLRNQLPGLAIQDLSDQCLLSLQGPRAVTVLSRLAPALNNQPYMSIRQVTLLGQACLVTRSGYSGEDGFEISLTHDHALIVAQALLDQPEVTAAGIGARDTLRQEAGYCLYGAELDETTTPVQAGLSWVIGKTRRQDQSFAGAIPIMAELETGPMRQRIGLILPTRQPVRADAPILNADGAQIGRVTSGTYSPCLDTAIAMGYVGLAYAEAGTNLAVMIRDKRVHAQVVTLPFVPHHTHTSRTISL